MTTEKGYSFSLSELDQDGMDWIERSDSGEIIAWDAGLLITAEAQLAIAERLERIAENQEQLIKVLGALSYNVERVADNIRNS